MTFQLKLKDVKKNPEKLWAAAEKHGRVQAVDAKGNVVIDLAMYGGPNGLRWDAP